MAGVFLLFKYGLPSNVLEGTVLIIEEKQEEANKRSRINKKNNYQIIYRVIFNWYWIFTPINKV